MFQHERENSRLMHEGVCHVEAKSCFRDLRWSDRYRDERPRRYACSACPDDDSEPIDCQLLNLGCDGEPVDPAGAVAPRSLGLGPAAPLAQSQLAQPPVVGRSLALLVSLILAADATVGDAAGLKQISAD
jgi:hypothetical protein